MLLNLLKKEAGAMGGHNGSGTSSGPVEQLSESHMGGEWRKP